MTNDSEQRAREEREAVARARNLILDDIRGRKLLKWLFAETADVDPHPIGYVEGPIDSATQRECAETWARLAFSVLKREPQPPLTREERVNLATVYAYEAGLEDGKREQSIVQPSPVNRLPRIHVRWSDDGHNIRKWSWHPFEEGEEVEVIAQPSPAPAMPEEVRDALEMARHTLLGASIGKVVVNYGPTIGAIDKAFAYILAPAAKDADRTDLRSRIVAILGGDPICSGRVCSGTIDAIVEVVSGRLSTPDRSAL